MIQAPVERLTFKEYCHLDNGDRYELVNGELVEMPPGRGNHALIIDALNDIFKAQIKQMGREWISLHSSIGVRIPQIGRKDTSRIPDICVASKAQWQGLLGSASKYGGSSKVKRHLLSNMIYGMSALRSPYYS